MFFGVRGGVVGVLSFLFLRVGWGGGGDGDVLGSSRDYQCLSQCRVLAQVPVGKNSVCHSLGSSSNSSIPCSGSSRDYQFLSQFRVIL